MSSASERTRWDTRFGGDEYHFGTEPNSFVAAQAHLLKPGMTALSVADGEGRNSVWLAQQGLRVTAFDFSPVGVAKARRLAQTKGVEVDHREANILEWDWDARQYDLVAAIFIQFMGPADRARVFAGMLRALAPGGILLLQGYTPKQHEYGTGGPKQVENLYTEALLREAFAALEIVQLREHEEMIAEGDAHTGMSALIDLVARKP